MVDAGSPRALRSAAWATYLAWLVCAAQGYAGGRGFAKLSTPPLLFALTLFASLSAQEAAAPIDIGQRRELFVDRALIEELDGVRMELATPRDEGGVFRFDRPWEGPFCGYATVIWDGRRFLLYYRGLPKAGGAGTNLERTCVAVSKDGGRFERPALSTYEIEGPETNNVVLAGAAPVSHNFSPFLDGHVAANSPHRFKALAGSEASGRRA